MEFTAGESQRVVCSCGTLFVLDAIICRKCGAHRSQGEKQTKAGIRDTAKFIEEGTLKSLTDPKSLNSGALEDIYKQNADDFEAPEMLEISYRDAKGRKMREIVFVDPVYANRRPRMCVAVEGVQAMHNAISILSRKVDNLVNTLSTCRGAYLRELTALNHSVAMLRGRDDELSHRSLSPPIMSRAASVQFFDPRKYSGEKTEEIVTRRVEAAVSDLSERMKLSQEENKRLEKRIKIYERDVGAVGDPAARVERLVSSMNIDKFLRLIRDTVETMERNVVDNFYFASETILNEHKGYNIAENEYKLKELKVAKEADDAKIDKLQQQLEEATVELKRHKVMLEAAHQMLDARRREQALQKAEQADLAQRLQSVTLELQEVMHLHSKLQTKVEKQKINFEEERQILQQDLLREREHCAKLEGRLSNDEGVVHVEDAKAADLTPEEFTVLAPQIFTKQGLVELCVTICTAFSDNRLALVISRLNHVRMSRHSSGNDMETEQPNSRRQSDCIASRHFVADYVDSLSLRQCMEVIGEASLRLDRDSAATCAAVLPAHIKKAIIIEGLTDAMDVARGRVRSSSALEAALHSDSEGEGYNCLFADTLVSINVGKDLSKKVRLELMQRIFKVSSGADVKRLAHKMPQKARRNLLLGILEKATASDFRKANSDIAQDWGAGLTVDVAMELVRSLRLRIPIDQFRSAFCDFEESESKAPANTTLQSLPPKSQSVRHADSKDTTKSPSVLRFSLQTTSQPSPTPSARLAGQPPPFGSEGNNSADVTIADDNVDLHELSVPLPANVPFGIQRRSSATAHEVTQTESSQDSPNIESEAAVEEKVDRVVLERSDWVEDETISSHANQEEEVETAPSCNHSPDVDRRHKSRDDEVEHADDSSDGEEDSGENMEDSEDEEEDEEEEEDKEEFSKPRRFKVKYRIWDARPDVMDPEDEDVTAWETSTQTDLSIGFDNSFGALAEDARKYMTVLVRQVEAEIRAVVQDRTANDEMISRGVPLQPSLSFMDWAFQSGVASTMSVGDASGSILEPFTSSYSRSASGIEKQPGVGTTPPRLRGTELRHHLPSLDEDAQSSTSKSESIEVERKESVVGDTSWTIGSVGVIEPTELPVDLDAVVAASSTNAFDATTAQSDEQIVESNAASISTNPCLDPRFQETMEGQGWTSVRSTSLLTRDDSNAVLEVVQTKVTILQAAAIVRDQLMTLCSLSEKEVNGWKQLAEHECDAVVGTSARHSCDDSRLMLAGARWLRAAALFASVCHSEAIILMEGAQSAAWQISQNALSRIASEMLAERVEVRLACKLAEALLVQDAENPKLISNLAHARAKNCAISSLRLAALSETLAKAEVGLVMSSPHEAIHARALRDKAMQEVAQDVKHHIALLLSSIGGIEEDALSSRPFFGSRQGTIAVVEGDMPPNLLAAAEVLEKKVSIPQKRRVLRDDASKQDQNNAALTRERADDHDRFNIGLLQQAADVRSGLENVEADLPAMDPGTESLRIAAEVSGQQRAQLIAAMTQQIAIADENVLEALERLKRQPLSEERRMEAQQRFSEMVHRSRSLRLALALEVPSAENASVFPLKEGNFRQSSSIGAGTLDPTVSARSLSKVRQFWRGRVNLLNQILGQVVAIMVDASDEGTDGQVGLDAESLRSSLDAAIYQLHLLESTSQQERRSSSTAQQERRRTSQLHLPQRQEQVDSSVQEDRFVSSTLVEQLQVQERPGQTALSPGDQMEAIRRVVARQRRQQIDNLSALEVIMVNAVDEPKMPDSRHSVVPSRENSAVNQQVHDGKPASARDDSMVGGADLEEGSRHDHFWANQKQQVELLKSALEDAETTMYGSLESGAMQRVQACATAWRSASTMALQLLHASTPGPDSQCAEEHTDRVDGVKICKVVSQEVPDEARWTTLEMAAATAILCERRPSDRNISSVPVLAGSQIGNADMVVQRRESESLRRYSSVQGSDLNQFQGCEPGNVRPECDISNSGAQGGRITQKLAFSHSPMERGRQKSKADSVSSSPKGVDSRKSPRHAQQDLFGVRGINSQSNEPSAPVFCEPSLQKELDGIDLGVNFEVTSDFLETCYASMVQAQNSPEKVRLIRRALSERLGKQLVDIGRSLLKTLGSKPQSETDSNLLQRQFLNVARIWRRFLGNPIVRANMWKPFVASDSAADLGSEGETAPALPPGENAVNLPPYRHSERHRKLANRDAREAQDDYGLGSVDSTSSAEDGGLDYARENGDSTALRIHALSVPNKTGAQVLASAMPGRSKYIPGPRSLTDMLSEVEAEPPWSAGSGDSAGCTGGSPTRAKRSLGRLHWDTLKNKLAGKGEEAPADLSQIVIQGRQLESTRVRSESLPRMSLELLLPSHGNSEEDLGLQPGALALGRRRSSNIYRRKSIEALKCSACGSLMPSSLRICKACGANRLSLSVDKIQEFEFESSRRKSILRVTPKLNQWSKLVGTSDESAGPELSEYSRSSREMEIEELASNAVNLRSALRFKGLFVSDLPQVPQAPQIARRAPVSQLLPASKALPQIASSDQSLDVALQSTPLSPPNSARRVSHIWRPPLTARHQREHPASGRALERQDFAGGPFSPMGALGVLGSKELGPLRDSPRPKPVVPNIPAEALNALKPKVSRFSESSPETGKPDSFPSILADPADTRRNMAHRLILGLEGDQSVDDTSRRDVHSFWAAGGSPAFRMRRSVVKNS